MFQLQESLNSINKPCTQTFNDLSRCIYYNSRRPWDYHSDYGPPQAYSSKNKITQKFKIQTEKNILLLIIHQNYAPVIFNLTIILQLDTSLYFISAYYHDVILIKIRITCSYSLSMKMITYQQISKKKKNRHLHILYLSFVNWTFNKLCCISCLWVHWQIS